MFNPQAGLQTACQSSYHLNGPPPFKKQKSSTIITRYPPPPGYRGPTQSGASYAAPTWQPPQPYQYGQVSPQHQRSYSVPHIQQQPYVQGHQGFRSPQNVYPSPITPGLTGYMTQGWPAAQSRRNTAHVITPLSAGPVDGNGDPLPPSLTPPGNDDELESEYDGECYFSRYPSEINPALSIGTIEWKPARQTRYALPATFALAEVEAIAPRKPPPPDEESVSEYFHRHKREEAFLSIRQTDLWESVKHDGIYKEFLLEPDDVLTMSQLHELYKNRPSPEWEATVKPSQVALLTRPNSPGFQQMDTGSDSRPTNAEEHEVGMLDELEQAISPAIPTTKQQSSQIPGPTSQYSASKLTYPENLSRPKPLPAFRSQTQEDILAALGVTGSPKTVFQTPGPAFGPIIARRGSTQDARKTKLPASPNQSQQPTNVVMHEDNENTPRPKFERQDSRKRGFDDTEESLDYGYQDPDNDTTPKPRCKQQRV